MRVLGIDTSTMTGGAAIIDNRGLVGEYVLNIRTTHSERLLPAIDQILTDANIDIEEIDAIAVVTGPGSFTGLRIGVATAKGFAYAVDKKLIGITAFQAFAWQHQVFSGFICPLIDAKREDVYLEIFWQGQSVHKPTYCSLDWVQNWCQEQSQSVLFVGDGAFVHKEALAGLANAVFPGIEGMVLRASSVASLGLELLTQGRSSDPFGLNPFYLRRSSAEYLHDKARETDDR